MTEQTENTVNIPLLRKAVEWAEAEAAKPYELCEWRQQMWVTPKPSDVRDDDVMWAEWGSTVKLGKSPECGTCFCIAGWVEFQASGDVTGEVTENAARLLGLPEARADHLFYAANTIADVRRIAEELAGERL